MPAAAGLFTGRVSRRPRLDSRAAWCWSGRDADAEIPAAMEEEPAAARHSPPRRRRRRPAVGEPRFPACRGAFRHCPGAAALGARRRGAAPNQPADRRRRARGYRAAVAAPSYCLFRSQGSLLSLPLAGSLLPFPPPLAEEGQVRARRSRAGGSSCLRRPAASRHLGGGVIDATVLSFSGCPELADSTRCAARRRCDPLSGPAMPAEAARSLRRSMPPAARLLAPINPAAAAAGLPRDPAGRRLWCSAPPAAAEPAEDRPVSRRWPDAWPPQPMDRPRRRRRVKIETTGSAHLWAARPSPPPSARLPAARPRDRHRRHDRRRLGIGSLPTAAAVDLPAGETR